MIFQRTKLANKALYPCAIEFLENDVPPKNDNVVYGLIDPRTDSVFYIGLTSNFPERMRNHSVVREKMLCYDEINERKLEIYRSGYNIQVCVLFRSISRKIAHQVELDLISTFYQSLCNRKVG